MLASHEKVYSIGQVSSLCNVSIKTLRYYDKIGLLVPAKRKDDSNYRYYTHEQIVILYFIRRLRHLGLPIKEIKDIILLSDTKKMECCIRQRLEEINQSIEQLNNQYTEGKQLLERLEKGYHLLEFEKSGWTTEGIRVEKIPSTLFVYKTHQEKLSKQRCIGRTVV